ncbi:MAG: AzlD domain-containing protein [Burkholderiaceae bacterium]|nr:AzlD domain-containing protein [Burkholderiaceae bacterium]
MSETDLIVILCGAGTFLLRFLPIWQNRRKVKSSTTSGAMQRFLQGIGPAAISALLAISLWSIVKDGQGIAPIVAAGLALLSIFLVKQKLGGIGGPTLAGAVVYGLLMHFAVGI